MSRTKLLMTVAGVTVAAGAAGCALGLLYAPASGTELRRRLAWKSDEQWRTIARASGRLIERVTARAAAEVEARKKRFAEAVGPC